MSHRVFPILYTIGQTQNVKMFDLFLSSLKHFCQVLLDEEFGLLRKYLNYNHCNHVIGADSYTFDQTGTDSFWGLSTADNGGNLGMIETMLKSQYFDGLNQMDERQVCFCVCFVVVNCVCFECDLVGFCSFELGEINCVELY